MIDGGVLVLVSAALIIGVILFLIIKFVPHAPHFDKEKYQSKWLEISKKANTGQRDSQFMAIIQADKLLDQALRESGSKGQTMAERMKTRQAAWSNANAVWSAHKLRNRIAHEEHVNLSDDAVRRALASFKRALKDLGAL